MYSVLVMLCYITIWNYSSTRFLTPFGMTTVYIFRGWWLVAASPPPTITPCKLRTQCHFDRREKSRKYYWTLSI